MAHYEARCEDYAHQKEGSLKKIVAASVSVLALGILLMGAIPAMAAGGSDFVCPVWNPDSQAGAKNPNAHAIAGGYFTIIPGENTGTQRANHLNVPAHATNNDGAGSPGNAATFVEPGSPKYSAIWNVPALP
jgi:hypothetical protein